MISENRSNRPMQMIAFIKFIHALLKLRFWIAFCRKAEKLSFVHIQYSNTSSTININVTQQFTNTRFALIFIVTIRCKSHYHPHQAY